MGTSLNGLNPASTYQALIKVGNNTNLNTTLKTLSDGAGNDLPMQASTTAINFTGTVSGVASGVSGAIQFSNGSAFASDASNLFWDDTNNRLGVGTNAPTSPLQVAGTITTQNLLTSGVIYGGSFWLQENGILALGQQAAGPSKFFVKGSGSTSATTALLVQNSGGGDLLKIRDDGFTTIGAGNQGITSDNATFSSYIVSNGTSGNVFGTFTSFISSAIVQCDSTSRGFLPPRMTTTQKNAIASPAEGLEMYDSTAKSPAYYDGTNWGYTGGALQNAAGNSGTLNISFAAGNIVNLTLNANTTLAFSNAVIGTYIIQVTQGATGANVLTYPASVKWAGGTAPTLTTTVGKTDILTFYHDGTNFFGTYSLNY